jgi:CubicO group peptidase (beta-lactamase class C family)
LKRGGWKTRAKLAGMTRLVALVLLSIAPVSLFGEQSAATIESRLDRVFAEATDAGSPGIAVLVRKNGQTLFQRGYGITDLRTHTPIDAQTDFRLASCTKQFTAMAVMLLVHDGKLRYDNRLTNIFPDFPDYGRRITIRSLLNHTSGLPDYEDLMDGASSAKPSPWTETHQIQDAEVLALLKAETKGKFVPGTQWSYSNSGYVVLGLVVAKVSGKPFPDFLRERIFKPLKMDHTLAYLKGQNEIPNRAYGHSKVGDALKETDQSATSATLGDGGVYSNLNDLALWDDALARHRLLSAAEMQPALTPVKLADGSQPHWASGPGDTNPQAGKLVSYGFGWFLDPYQGHARMWHYGDTIGFKSAMQRFTKDKLTIILLSNRADLDPAALASKIADVYFTATK